MVAKKNKWWYDEDLANRCVSFIETQCVHMKGELAGETLVLEDFQKEFVQELLGWKDRDGLRKYLEAFLFMPRKNAKTTLIAGLALIGLFLDNEPGAEIYCAAADREQAKIIFSVMRHMVESNPEMSRRADCFRDTIVLKEDKSFIKALSAEAYTKHGFNGHWIIIDETHTQPNRELYDVLTTSVGSRRQPLIINLTTAGNDKQSFCFKLYDRACKVRDGVLEDERFLPVIYEANEEDDPFDPETWKKSNPGLGVTVRYDYIERKALLAKADPSFYNTFLQLHLNRWVNSDSAWITPEDFQKCNLALIDVSALEGRECYGGLDLASTEDTTAFVLEFPDDETGISTVLVWCWVPMAKAEIATKKNEYDYLTAIRNGDIIGVPGNVTDYNFVKKTIRQCAETFDVRGINVDRWNSSQMIIDLIDEGLPMNRFGQGYGSMSQPTKELGKSIISQKVNHGGHAVLAWQMSNTVLQYDAAENVKPAKDKSKGRIDVIVAWVMARAAFMQRNEGGPGNSIYNERGIISI